MFKVFMTEALIANVNDYVIKNVLPIAPSPDDERTTRDCGDRDGRRPFRTDNNMRAPRGFQTAGGVFPLKEFKTLTVLSEIGIPLFDGHGEVWLINTGIVVVFKDAEIYFVIHEIRLHNWLLSEIHNALFVEYNKLIAAPIANRNAPALREVEEITVEDLATQPEIRYYELAKYFQDDQFCPEIAAPATGSDLDRTGKRELIRTLSYLISSTGIGVEEGLFSPIICDDKGENLISSPKATIDTCKRAMYALLQASAANFIHVINDGAVKLKLPLKLGEKETMTVTLDDVVLLHDGAERVLLLRFYERPAEAIFVTLSREELQVLWDFMRTYGRSTLKMADVLKWINSHMFKLP